MNKYIVAALAIILLTSISYPQKMRGKMMKNKNKLEQLEKIKLVEALELKEDIAIRFFARRNDSRKEIEYLEKKSDELLLDLENSIALEDKNQETKQKQIISEIFKTRESIESTRNKFINSLNDILTTQQISKLVVFEKKFRDEIRNVLLNRKTLMNN
jgi:hypothetical protein